MELKMVRIYLAILTLSLTVSCSSTQKAWSNFKPYEYAYVIPMEKTPSHY